MILGLLSIYSLAVCSRALCSPHSAPMASTHGLAHGVNLMRLFENAGMLLLLLLHSRAVYVALAAAAIRTVGIVVLFRLLVYKLPWISAGITHASWRRIREATRPALAFMAFPAGNALSIQGMTILIGLMLGPVAVATFNPMRTLSRFAYQILDSIKAAVWPELSAAYGARNWPGPKPSPLLLSGGVLVGDTCGRRTRHCRTHSFPRVDAAARCLGLPFGVSICCLLWSSPAHFGTRVRPYQLQRTSMSILQSDICLGRPHLWSLRICSCCVLVWSEQRLPSLLPTFGWDVLSYEVAIAC